MQDQPPKRKRIRSPAQILKSRERNSLSHKDRSPAEKLEREWRALAVPPKPRAGSGNSRIRRKVNLAQSNVAWSDNEECYRTYMAAYVLSGVFGESYVVDHSVPLISSLVCGLHSHTNLNVIRAPLNRLKSNCFWPDMWPIGWEAIEFLEEFSKYPRDSSPN
jgi:hypothetical protein